MRLLDVLAANRELANAAGGFRDLREKKASTKEATPAQAWAHLKGLVGGAAKKVTGLFTPTAEELVARAAKQEMAQRLQVLQATSPIGGAIPTPATQPLFDYATKSLPGGRTQLGQEVEALKSIAQGMGDGKKPGATARTLAVMALGAGSAGTALGTFMEKHRHQANLELIIKDPSIPVSHKQKAENAFSILATYAPSIANDPIFSKDFVRNLVRFDMIDHKVVADLIQAEKNFLETKGKKAMFLGSMRDTALGVLLGSGG